MDYYDLIIVGAGPAGSTLASALENSGKKVLIIDKQNFPAGRGERSRRRSQLWYSPV